MSGSRGEKQRLDRAREPVPLHTVFYFLIVIVLALAGPVTAVPVAVTGNASVNGTAGNLTSGNITAGRDIPTPLMNAPAEPLTEVTPAPGQSGMYNRGYPIPVPVLIVTGIIVLAAGGFMTRRRRNPR